MCALARQARIALLIAGTGLAALSGARAESRLQRVEVPACEPRGEVVFDIGKLVEAGKVQPAGAVSVDEPNTTTVLSHGGLGDLTPLG